MNKRILEFLVECHEVSDRPMPVRLERRLKSDPELKVSHEREREVTRRLSRRDPESGEPSPFLAERIIANLDGTELMRETAFSWKSITVALVACLTVAVAFHWSSQTRESDGHIARDAAGDREATPLAAGEIPFYQAEGLLSDTDWKNPLNQEIERFLSDAKGAVGFRAESFLPTTVLDTEQKG